MKSIMLALLLTVGVAGAAAADQPGEDWISLANLKAKLQSLGYTGALAEADDGQWEGLAVKDGAIFKFEADPLTGEIRRSWPMSDGDL